MTARARLGLCALAALSALSAVVAQPAPPPVFGVHESNPAGQIWQGGTAAYAEFIHTNQWECIGTLTRTHPITGQKFYSNCEDHTLAESSIKLDGAPHGTVRTVTCDVTTVNGGCGHSGGNRWHWVDGAYHDQPNAPKPGSRQCTVGETSRPIADNADPAHCGTWTACTGGGVPNADRSSCVPCPSGQIPNADSSGCVDDLACPDGDDHRHATGAGTSHTICAASHDPPECLADLGPELRGEWAGPGHAGDPADGHAAVGGIAGCPVEPACDTDVHHTHSGDGAHDCSAAHAPPKCWTASTWSPGHAGETGDGHRLFTGVPICPPPTETPPPEPVTPPPECGTGEHRHAQASGGHTGCRGRHTAPSCTWSDDLTWSPLHAGSAADGHTTTTGMAKCVSARTFCAAQLSGPLVDTVERQYPGSAVGPGDNRGLLPSRYHRDRVPYGSYAAHRQFAPALTFDGVASPGEIRIQPGAWSTVAGSTPTPAAGHSIAAEFYDHDINRDPPPPQPRWRNCGRVKWSRTALTFAVTGGLELSGGRVRFPDGQPCPARAASLTITAAWEVKFNSAAGDRYDVTETAHTRSFWRVGCGPSKSVAAVCDALTGPAKAARMFEQLRSRNPVSLSNDGDAYETRPFYAPHPQWCPTTAPPAGCYPALSGGSTPLRRPKGPRCWPATTRAAATWRGRPRCTWPTRPTGPRMTAAGSRSGSSC